MFVRPEWNDISAQMYFESHPDELDKYLTGEDEDKNNRPFNPVNVGNLKVAVINKKALKGALKIKVTK